MGSHNCNCRCIMPASPELEEKIFKTRQSLIERRHSGKELLDFNPEKDMIDLNSFFTLLNRPSKTFPDKLFSPSWDYSPITGVRKVMFFLVDFSDHEATLPSSHYQEMLVSLNSYGTGSKREYYKEASCIQLDVIGEVFGWFRAPNPKSYYTDKNFGFGNYPQNAQKLVEDVLDLANGEVSLSPYDNNGNGIIEDVALITAGSGAEQTGNVNDIWTHRWGIATKTVNGKKVDRYFMAPEDGRVRVRSHELGPLLVNCPDLYDLDYSPSGTGQRGLMAGGS